LGGFEPWLWGILWGQIAQAPKRESKQKNVADDGSARALSSASPNPNAPCRKVSPLSRQLRTQLGHRRMSQKGQKQTKCDAAILLLFDHLVGE
jgi:hypothetical protein